MDTGAIGAQYLEQYRYSVDNLPLARDSGRAGTSVFADYLDEALQEGEKTGAAKPRKPSIDKTSKLYEQCQELETFLVKNLLTGMRNTVQKSGLIEDGLAGKFYEDMLWDEYAKSFTRNAGFGLADQAYLELTGQRSGRAPSVN
ncbi:MAG: rod-binding protein [Treponema sp.]|jgi:flagellar protein FlgJ|nr:rod-binding protein [Treponema sp.]